MPHRSLPTVRHPEARSCTRTLQQRCRMLLQKHVLLHGSQMPLLHAVCGGDRGSRSQCWSCNASGCRRR